MFRASRVWCWWWKVTTFSSRCKRKWLLNLRMHIWTYQNVLLDKFKHLSALRWTLQWCSWCLCVCVCVCVCACVCVCVCECVCECVLSGHKVYRISINTSHMNSNHVQSHIFTTLVTNSSVFIVMVSAGQSQGLRSPRALPSRSEYHRWMTQTDRFLKRLLGVVLPEYSGLLRQCPCPFLWETSSRVYFQTSFRSVQCLGWLDRRGNLRD